MVPGIRGTYPAPAPVTTNNTALRPNVFTRMRPERQTENKQLAHPDSRLDLKTLAGVLARRSQKNRGIFHRHLGLARGEPAFSNNDSL
jgi:hypothetical protein